jgi:hypothetical protein
MSNVLNRLGSLGATYRDPVAAIDWQAGDASLPWLPLDMIGVDILGTDDPELAIRLSQIEFARLCAAGLWLEGLLIGRVARHGFLAIGADEIRVVLQEVREEAGHGLMFLEMIGRAGLARTRLLGPTTLLSWVANRLNPDDAAFWAMVYIGESVTDTFALRALRGAGKSGAAICPVARQVLSLHHRDEARHIAAARALLETRIATMSTASRLIFGRTAHFLLGRFLRATLFPTPASLAALGLDDPVAAARAAARCPARRQLARDCAAPALELIARSGIAKR